jgi:hypothetical protein
MPVIAVGDTDKICLLEATERESFTSQHKGTACVALSCCCDGLVVVFVVLQGASPTLTLSLASSVCAVVGHAQDHALPQLP